MLGERNSTPLHLGGESDECGAGGWEARRGPGGRGGPGGRQLHLSAAHCRSIDSQISSKPSARSRGPAQGHREAGEQHQGTTTCSSTSPCWWRTRWRWVPRGWGGGFLRRGGGPRESHGVSREGEASGIGVAESQNPSTPVEEGTWDADA